MTVKAMAKTGIVKMAFRHLKRHDDELTMTIAIIVTMLRLKRA